MGEFTDTTHGVFEPEIWSKEFLDQVESRLVMSKLVTHDYENEIQEYGDTVHIPDVSGLTVGTKTFDSDVTFEANTEGENTITIDQWKFTAFKVPKKVMKQSRYDLRAIYSKRATYALAQNIDSALYTEFYADVTQNAGASTDSATTADVSLLRAIQYLDDAEAPEEDRGMVVKPSEKNLLMQNSKFTSANIRGDGQNPVARGFFTQIYGMPAYYSTQVNMNGTESKNLIFHKETLAIAVQSDITVDAEYNIRSLAWEVVADVLYGKAGLRSTFGVIFKGV